MTSFGEKKIINRRKYIRRDFDSRPNLSNSSLFSKEFLYCDSYRDSNNNIKLKLTNLYLFIINQTRNRCGVSCDILTRMNQILGNFARSVFYISKRLRKYQRTDAVAFIAFKRINESMKFLSNHRVLYLTRHQSPGIVAVNCFSIGISSNSVQS